MPSRHSVDGSHRACLRLGMYAVMARRCSHEAALWITLPSIRSAPHRFPEGKKVNARMLPLIVWSFFMVASYAAEADYRPVEGWLKPAAEMETIGPAHGDVAVSASGDVYVSILSGPR